MSQYTIPTDPIELLRDRVLFIVGAGRSGTTILGKLIGSMRPTFYLFEPTLFRSWIYPNTTCSPQGQAAMRSILFEDYILPLVQGRSVNTNPLDDSYVGNYAMGLDLQQRREKLRRRGDAIEYIQEHKPLFVIKDPELMVVADELKQVFPGCRFIHIIRNGLDVVASCMKRGWYTDEFMDDGLAFWCREALVSSNDKPRLSWKAKNPAPWYLSDQDAIRFCQYDPPTRAALVWRVLVEKEWETQPEILYYEQLKDIERGWLTRIYRDQTGAFETGITQRHIDSIRNFTPASHDLTLADIQQPERDKFAGCMERLGYEV